jgi:hypothetical protein
MIHSTFLTLPALLLVKVLTVWINIVEVAKLDSSVCQKHTRPLFLSVAYGKYTTYTAHSAQLQHAFVTWSLRRGVRLHGLSLVTRSLSDDQLRRTVLKLLCSNLQWLILSGDTEDCGKVLVDIAVWCQHLRAVEVIATSPNYVHTIDDYELDTVELKRERELDYCFLAIVRACPPLDALSLHEVRLTHRGLAQTLKQCSALTRLTLRGVYQFLPQEIAVPTLKWLDIRSCIVGDAVLAAIGRNCPRLEHLYCFGTATSYTRINTYITDIGVRALLQGCSRLRETDVEYAVRISNPLRTELAHRSNYTTLAFQYWERVDDNLVSGVINGSPALQHLNCAGCEFLTDGSLAVCAQQCPLLQTVDVSNCFNITAEGIEQLLRPGNKLRAVDFNGCRQLDDRVVLAMAQHCPLLQDCFCGGAAVSDSSIVKLAEGCLQLRKVSLYGTGLGDNGVTALATHCTKLHSLYIPDCPNLTLEGVRAIAGLAVNLAILVLPCALCTLLLPPMKATRLQVMFE